MLLVWRALLVLASVCWYGGFSFVVASLDCLPLELTCYYFALYSIECGGA